MPYLKAENIAFDYVYTTNAANISSLQTLLALLNFLGLYASARPAHAEAWLPQIIASAELGLSPEQYLRLALEARSHKLPLSRGGISWFAALQASEDPDMIRLHTWLMEMMAAAATRPVREMILEAARPLQEY